MKYPLNNIYNEDCYKAIKNIPENSIDLIVIDPPYLYDTGGGAGLMAEKNADGTLRRKVYSDKYFKSITTGFDFSIFNEFERILKKKQLFIFCSKMQMPEILNYFIALGYNYDFLIWHKTNPTPFTNNTWLPDKEIILYFRKDVKLNDGYELKRTIFTSSVNIEDKNNFSHPTIKPIELIKQYILHTTNENDVVLDLFIGSGTTAIAAKELNRQYLGFEIEKKYFDIAVDRLNGINTTGQTSIFTDFNKVIKDNKL